MKIEREKIVEFINDNQNFHSNFQIDNFIIGNAGSTVYGRYVQAVRELSSRYESLKNAYLDREIKEIDLKIAEEDHNLIGALDETRLNLLKRKSQINIIRKNSELENINKIIIDREREFARFYRHCQILKEKLGILTNEKRNELDQEYWFNKLKASSVLDLLTTGHIQGSTLELIASIPTQQRKTLLESLNTDNLEKSIEWFYDKGISFELDNKLLDSNVENFKEIKKLVDGDIHVN